MSDVRMDLLSTEQVEDWRRGRVPYLEQVVRCNLTKLSRLLRILRFHSEFVERKLASGEDVPMVEDFPLAPEEETPDFRELATTLQLRGVRALERWRGKTHLTLSALIVRMIKEQSADRDLHMR